MTKKNTNKTRENRLIMKKFKKVSLKNMLPWQRNRLIISVGLFLAIGISFLSCTVSSLYQDKKSEDKYWDEYLQIDPEVEQKMNTFNQDATRVKIGTYVENLKEINLKSNNFSIDYLVWFNWQGDPELDMANNFRIYKGNITKKELIKDYHEGATNYQLVRVSVTISKTFWTPRFPLESHQLRIYVESNLDAGSVVFVKEDKAQANPNLSIAGYDFTRIDSAVVANEYTSNNGDPTYEGSTINSEYVTQFEITRSDFGTYFKCFIALLGTTTWVFITLYINTNHRVDPLGMIPAALFGTVSNIMIGANLLPDALQVGLLEYVNFWGIFTILSVTFTVINVNRIRNKYEDKNFAHFYGLVMFWLILTVVITGHILLPIAAFIF